MTIIALSTNARSSTHAGDSSTPLDFFRGLAIALPLGLRSWTAILGQAWRVWQG